MNRLRDYFRLVRFQNLLIIVLLFEGLYYWYYWKFIPLLHPNASGTLFSFFTLQIIILAVLCIASAGYIINDYFDIRTDEMNRPERVLAGRVFSRSWLIFMNLVLNIAGILLGFCASFLSGHLSLGIIYPMASVLLLFYSTHLKRYPWIGNITVALLIGFLPFLFYLNILSWYHVRSSDINPEIFFWMRKMFKFILLYGIFAFLLSLIREIVKDIEDMEGDAQTGAITIPVKYGLESAKIFAFLINLILFLLILFVIYNTFRYNTSTDVLYLLFLVIHLLFSVMNGWLIIRAKNKAHFSRISIWLKFVMLFGLCLPLVLQM